MNRTATINTRVDPEIKAQALEVLDALGMSLSQAISIFLRQVAVTKSIPFEVRIPNETTIKTHEQAKAGKELHTVSSVEELAAELTS